MADVLKSVHVSPEPHYLKTNTPVADSLVTAQSAPVTIQDDLFDELKHRAHETAFAQGYDQGLAKAQSEMNEHIQTLTALIDNLPAAVSDNRHHLSTEIADIVLTIIQQLFINQQQNKDHIALQITQTINQLNDKQSVELRLHPQDLALIQQGLLTLDLKQRKNLRIIADDRLRLGGFLVRSEHGVFDASIERQIDRLKQVLLQIRQGESGDSLD